MKRWHFPEILENDFVEESLRKRTLLIERAESGDTSAINVLSKKYSLKIYTEAERRKLEKTYFSHEDFLGS